MDTLDITFDFETCALAPTAAVMSVGAVAWNRESEDNPFVLDPMHLCDYSFYKHVDLRSSFLDGFSFDKDTSNWWAAQPIDAKRALLDYDDTPILPIKEVIDSFFSYIKEVKSLFYARQVHLWSQGTDFDIAILRNICNIYNLSMPINYHDFRDHRTFYMEGARVLCQLAGVDFEPSRAYLMVDDYECDGTAHDPVYDCKHSIWATWQMMKHLRGLSINKQSSL